MHDHVARMLGEAKERLHEADILARSLASGSGESLLRILALEVLLKAAQYATLGRYQPHHRYRELWKALSPEVTAPVLEVARDCYPGRADLSDLDALLDDWQFAFTKGRYFFELHEGHSAAEQQRIGEAWISRGAPMHEAEVRFHPLELSALTEGLVTYLEGV